MGGIKCFKHNALPNAEWAHVTLKSHTVTQKCCYFVNLTFESSLFFFTADRNKRVDRV